MYNKAMYMPFLATRSNESLKFIGISVTTIKNEKQAHSQFMTCYHNVSEYRYLLKYFMLSDKCMVLRCLFKWQAVYKNSTC